MTTLDKRLRYSVWFGSALLAFVALFHFSGFFAIPTEPGGGASFFEASLRPLWLFASLHWLLIAVICIFVIKSGHQHARLILLCCAATVLADAALLYFFIGPFIGSVILAVAGIAFGIGTIDNRRDVKLETG